MSDFGMSQANNSSIFEGFRIHLGNKMDNKQGSRQLPKLLPRGFNLLVLFQHVGTPAYSESG